MTDFTAVEVAVRALFEPRPVPRWTPAQPPEPLDAHLAGLLDQLALGPWNGELRLALALRRDPEQRKAAIRSALALAGLPDLIAAKADRTWIGFRLRLLAAIWRAAAANPPALCVAERVDAAVRAAVGYLDPNRLPIEAADVPRLGILDPQGRFGLVFPVAVIGAALQEAGCDVTQLINAILTSRHQHLGWTYWAPELLPPDIDTLGQVLQVLAAGLPPGEAASVSSEAVTLAMAHIQPDGSVLTSWPTGACGPASRPTLSGRSGCVRCSSPIFTWGYCVWMVLDSPRS
jgi:hypothetical protein